VRKRGTRHKAQGTRQRAEGRCQIETVIGNRLSPARRSPPSIARYVRWTGLGAGGVIGICLLLATYYSLLTTSLAIDYGETIGQGGVPGEYLFSFGSGAGPLSVGGAYTAREGGLGCVYYNPAGLASLGNHEVSLFYSDSEVLLGTKYNFLGYGFPIKEGRVLGVSYFSLLSPFSTRRTIWEGATTSFQERNTAYILSYGHRVNPKLSAGANLKFVYQSFCDQSALGYGLDLGTLYKPFKFLSLGVNIQDALPPKLELISGKPETFPLNLRGGLTVILFGERLFFTTDACMLDILGSPFFRWFAGGEVRWKIFALRGGINYKEITAGIGIVTRKFQFDYGASFHQRGVTHRLSISARYGLLPTVEEQQLALKREKLQKEKFRTEQLRQQIAEEREIVNKIRRDTMSKKFSLAERYLAEGDYRGALTELQEILQMNPDERRALRLMERIDTSRVKAEEYYLLVLECYANADYKKAQKLIKKGLALVPTHQGLLLFKELTQARIYLKQRRYTLAKQILLKAVKLAPENEETLELLRRTQEIIDAENRLRTK